MQQQMEAGEQEYNNLVERLNPPGDWSNPDWGLKDKVHNWRNYASEDLQAEWLMMSGKQRMIVSACLNEIADNEIWE